MINTVGKAKIELVTLISWIVFMNNSELNNIIFESIIIKEITE